MAGAANNPSWLAVVTLDTTIIRPPRQVKIRSVKPPSTHRLLRRCWRSRCCVAACAIADASGDAAKAIGEGMAGVIGVPALPIGEDVPVANGTPMGTRYLPAESSVRF